jgi:hypothetical protein
VLSQKSTKNPRLHIPFSESKILNLKSKFLKFLKLPAGLQKVAGESSKHPLNLVEHFQNFELEIKIFKILKPPAGLQKVTSYAGESSKHPLNLVDFCYAIQWKH